MGNIKVREYLTRFKRRGLPEDSNKVFIEDGERIEDKGTVIGAHNRNNVNRYLMDKRLMYVKDYGETDWTPWSVMECLTGHVYNDLGVNSSLGYPLRRSNGNLAIATQDVSHLGKWIKDKETNVVSLEEIVGEIFKRTEPFKMLNREKLKMYNINHYDYQKTNMWGCVLNPAFRKEMLEYMTPQCYEDLKNMYVLDVIMGNPDRHYLNYFLTKKKGGDKWQSVIAFDNESNIYRDTLKEFRGTPKEIYNLAHSTVSNFYTPQLVKDGITHVERLDDLRNHVVNGKFNRSQYELLERMVNYDLPSKMNTMYKVHDIKGKDVNKLKDVVSMAWETNQKMIDKAME